MQGEIAVDEEIEVFLAEAQHGLPEAEHAVLVALLLLDVEGRVAVVDPHPGRAGGEAGVRRAVPVHGRARVVAADGADAAHRLRQRVGIAGGPLAHQPQVVHRLHVLEICRRPCVRDVDHADLLALVQEQRPRQRRQHQREQFAAPGPVRGRVVAQPRDTPGLVVVFEEGRGPCVGAFGQRLHPVERGLERRQRVGDGLELVIRALAQIHHVELEDHVQHRISCRDVRPHGFRLRRVGQLAHGHAIIFTQHFCVHLAEVFVHAGSVAEKVRRELEIAQGIDDGGVGEGRGFAVHVDRVDAEAIDAFVQPELDRRGIDSVAGGWIFPVQVGLGGEEEVEVVFPAAVVPFPRRAAKVSAPIVRRLAGPVGVVSGRPPDIPVPLGTVFRAPGLAEPGVLVGGMVDHEVEDDPHAAGVTGLDESFGIGDGAVGRVDVFVVGDVVAHIVLGRSVTR